MTVSDERLMTIKALADQDPVIAEKIARFRAQRALVSGAFADVLREDPPARLIDSIHAGANRARNKTFLRAGAVGMAMAASFAAGWVVTPRDTVAPIVAQADGLLAQGALQRALNAQASGSFQDGIAIAMTTPTKNGGVCRAFITDIGAQAIEGVACTQNAQDSQSAWRLTAIASAGSASDTSDYRTAASAMSPAILAALDAERDGDPLGAAEEKAWIAARTAR
jgi:hypothetical protein